MDDDEISCGRSAVASQRRDSSVHRGSVGFVGSSAIMNQKF